MKNDYQRALSSNLSAGAHTPFPRGGPICSWSAAWRRIFCAAGSPVEIPLPLSETCTHTFGGASHGDQTIRGWHCCLTRVHKTEAATAGSPLLSPPLHNERTTYVVGMYVQYGVPVDKLAHGDPVWFDESTTSSKTSLLTVREHPFLRERGHSRLEIALVVPTADPY